MSAHSRSALKTSSLSKENERLSKEIQKMETVLKRHRHILNAEEDSLRGQIRKEVGGSKWVTGARGQLTGYKSSKTLGKYPASKSEPKKKSRTQENVYRGETKASATAKEKNQRVTPSNPDMPSLGQTSNPGLKSEGRTYQGLSAKGIRVGKSPNINNVEAVDDANGTAPYSERIATMKAKVLAKASAKVKTPKKESSPKSVESDGEMTKVMQGDAESKIDSTLTSNIIENIRDPPTKDPIHICIPAPGVSSSSESNDGETSTSIITQQICTQNNLKEHVTSTSEISQTRDGRKNENLKLECNASGSESESQDSESRKIIPKIVDGEEEVNADRVSVPLRLNNEPRTNANRPHPDKDPLLYDPVLSVWMYGLKLLDTEQYIRVFVENEVTMKRLKLLNEKQLREFGITSPGPLSKIMHGIKLLNKEVTACSQKFDLQRASSEMSSTRRDQAKQNNIKEYHSSAGSVTIEASGGHGHTSTEMCSQNIEARQVRSADTTGIEKKIPKIRPVSSNVTQRTLASGIHAASHKLKRQRELQEKEKQHQEKIQKLKKAERDKMAAQFHLRKKINKENKRRKSSSSDEVMSDRTHDSEHNSDGIEDLLAVYTKGVQGSQVTPSNTSKPESPSKTRNSVYVQKVGKSERPSSASIPSNIASSSFVVQGDQLIDSGRTNRSKKSDSHRSSKSVDVSPPPTAECRLQELEIQVLSLQQKGKDSTDITKELVDKLQKQLQDIQSDIFKQTSVTGQDKVEPTKTKAVVESTKPGKTKSKNTVTKRELMREVRKQKEEHRKHIRHLESELHRLKHREPNKSCEIPENDILINEADLIGEGSFSQVFRGYYHGSEVAIKRLKTPLSIQDKNYFAEEVNLLRELRHPRVVLLLGVCTLSKLPLMVLEFMSKGSLYSLLHNSTIPPLDHVSYFQVARDVCLGMNYLHRHKPSVLHMDLKTMNVLIGTHGRAKIGDFGFSKLRHDADVVASKTGSMKGTPAWMAPELLDPSVGDISTKVDVYSFGIILWEMLTRQRPYQGLSMFQIMERVRENKRPEIPESCPIKLGKLITMCWDPKPNKRPSFKDILISLEGLSFPPEWRDLFAAAGIPREAMNDVQSARSIIELVNKSVELSDKELMTSVRVVPKLDLQLSMDDNIIPCLDGQHVYQMNDSMSEDEDWNVKSIKESIDEFELKIPQSVLDTMHDNTAVDEQHHVHLPVLECNESDLVSDGISERSVISEQCSVKSATDVHSDRSGGSGKHSVRFSDIDTHLGELPAAESKVLSLKSLVKFDHPASSVQLPKDKVTSEKGDHSSIRFENGKSSPTKGTSPRRQEKIHISEARDSSDKPARLSTAWEKNLPTVQKQPGNIPLPPPLPDVARSLAITQGARPKKSHSLKKTHPLRKTLAAPAASHVKIPVSELLKQKAKLKSTDNPHPSQLADLTRISHDKLTSIAEILKKAVTHRRVAMGEDAGSIEHSYPSGVWSVEEH